MHNDDAKHLIGIKGEILALRSHITFVETCIFFLTRRYDREVIDKLIAQGYPGEYPEFDYPNYLKQLDRVQSLSKTHVFKLWELVEEENRIEKDKMGAKATEEDFEKNIVRLSKYQGYRINKFKISPFEYASIHNNFIEEIKSNRYNPPDT